jgi:hypothetical protein
MAAAKAHVEKHLKQRKIDPASVHPDVIEAFNACTEDELKAMDRLIESMEKAGIDSQQRLSMVH